MKRFYIAIILFVFPILLFLGGTECYVRSLPNVYKYKNDWMEQHAEEVETLILGSSHALDGINPGYLGSHSFNLANLGQTIKYDHFLFFKWSDKYKNLKVVIQPISYFSFFFFDMEEVREVYYSLYMDYPSSFPNLEILNYKPSILKICNSMKGKGLECQANGWACRSVSGKDTLWNRDYVTKALIRKQTAKSWSCVDDNYRYICEMASYCKSQDIKFVLVAPPHTEHYNQWLDKKQLLMTRKIINKLRNQFDLAFYDYREDPRFVDDDFIDQSHLSEVGAEKFTKLLKQDLQVNTNKLEN